jgi:hypothetical protein
VEFVDTVCKQSRRGRFFEKTYVSGKIRLIISQMKKKAQHIILFSVIPESSAGMSNMKIRLLWVPSIFLSNTIHFFSVK